MVNTFVTTRRKAPRNAGVEYVPDYRASAATLDLLRLRKQCVEAYQLINILDQLHRIVELEDWTRCTPVYSDEHTLPPAEQATRYLSRVEWVKSTRARYLKLPYRYVNIDGMMFTVSKDDIPYRVDKSTGRYTINSDETVTVWIKNTELSKMTLPAGVESIDESSTDYDLSEGKRLRTRTAVLFPRRQVALPSDDVYTLGFSQHAIVKMWVGYEDSLREYINAHVAEYCTHTTKSGDQCSIDIPHYTILDDHPHPWWITSYDGVILSHRASLLRKERERSEPKWYWGDEMFTSTPDEWMNTGYVWTGSLDPDLAEQLITDILSGKQVYPSEVTAPISADGRPAKSQAYLRKKHNYDGPYLLDQDGYVKIKIINRK